MAEEEAAVVSVEVVEAEEDAKGEEETERVEVLRGRRGNREEADVFVAASA